MTASCPAPAWFLPAICTLYALKTQRATGTQNAKGDGHSKFDGKCSRLVIETAKEGEQIEQPPPADALPALSALRW